MRFRQHRLQRFEVGMNVGDDEKLHADHHHTKRRTLPWFPSILVGPASSGKGRPKRIDLRRQSRLPGNAAPVYTDGSGGVRITPFPTADNSYSSFAVGVSGKNPSQANHKISEYGDLSMDQIWFAAALWLLLAWRPSCWPTGCECRRRSPRSWSAWPPVDCRNGGGRQCARRKGAVDYVPGGTGSVVLIFLAGAELDPDVFREKWKESSAVVSLDSPLRFLGATAVAHYVLGWAWRASWLGGVALSTLR